MRLMAVRQPCAVEVVRRRFSWGRECQSVPVPAETRERSWYYLAVPLHARTRYACLPRITGRDCTCHQHLIIHDHSQNIPLIYLDSGLITSVLPGFHCFHLPDSQGQTLHWSELLAALVTSPPLSPNKVKTQAILVARCPSLTFGQLTSPFLNRRRVATHNLLKTSRSRPVHCTPYPTSITAHSRGLYS